MKKSRTERLVCTIAIIFCLAAGMAFPLSFELTNDNKIVGRILSISGSQILLETDEGFELSLSKSQLKSPDDSFIQAARTLLETGKMSEARDVCRYILLFDESNAEALRIIDTLDNPPDLASSVESVIITPTPLIEPVVMPVVVSTPQTPPKMDSQIHTTTTTETTQISIMTPDTPTSKFSFIHMSDIHISPYFSVPGDLSSARSYETIRSIVDMASILLEPFRTTAPPPSFIIITGDFTEFGFPGAVWKVIEQYFAGIDIPIYYSPGNHDVTWVMDSQTMRRLFGGINYSFDYNGCHFIGLCSATIQEPVPSLGEELIQFVISDLAKVDDSVPVFVFLHHPLQGTEFCSRYDIDRLLDALRTDNVVLIMDGHGHGAVNHNYSGIDGVEGGSTFSKNTPTKGGYNVVYVNDDDLFVAYRQCDERAATKSLIRKTIPSSADYPMIDIESPVADSPILSDSLSIKAKISNLDKKIQRAYYEIDDEIKGDMSCFNFAAAAVPTLQTLTNGAHFLRINFEDSDKRVYHKSMTFYIERPDVKDMGIAQWRFKMNGASKATPLVHKGKVFIGCNTGDFYALDEEAGSVAWTLNFGAEILSSAAVWNDTILFGAGNGIFYGVTPEGSIKWNFDAGAAVYSSPVVDNNGIVYFGNNKAQLYALKAATGETIWINSDAQYSIESQPFVKDGKVFFGAWDGYVFCVDALSGATIWKKPGPKNQGRVITYYAPADNGPVVAGERVFIADRGYVAGEYALDGTFKREISTGCSAIALSQDATSLYLRYTGNPLQKMSLDGKPLWTSAVTAGRLPISPTENDGILYVCTNSGTLYALDATTGSGLWKYQVTPKLYVMGGVAVDKGVAFLAGMDGSLTAIVPSGTPATSK